MDVHSSGYYLIDPEFNVLHVNETTRNIYPNLKIGEKCYACLMGLDSPCPPCPIVNGVIGPRTYVDPIRNIRESVDAVEVPIEGKGLCHALVFSTVGENAEFAATLPNTAEDLKNLALIKALTVNLFDVFSVNMTDGTTILYRLNGKPIEATADYNQNSFYAERTESYIAKYVHPDEKEEVRRQCELSYIKEKLQEKEEFSVHYRVILHDEEHHYCRRAVRIGDADDFSNIVIGVYCEDQEVLDRQKKAELEKNLTEVEYDSLTGLYTKEAFMLRGQSLLSVYKDKEYDLCVLKLENYGLLSHQYGIQSTEKVLTVIGKLLQAYEAEDNCIAYMGDGVYVSLTVNTPERVRKNNIFHFRQEIFEQSEIKNLSLRWSIYREISRELPLSTLYENTMYALTTIRAGVHDDYVEFDESVLQKMEREAALEHGFEKALENGEFVPWYQPKYSVKTQKIIGAEALVRWKRADGTIITPDEFIPIIERSGKIGLLDAFIYQETCKLQQKLEKLGIGVVPISVNLSRASMFTESIAEKYYQVAEQYQVETKMIPIEITESAAIRATAIRDFAKAFTEKGFRLHMDDFGAGYSSLASLLVIPFDSIKLDKSMIDYIGHDENDIMLKHVISFAHETGKKVIAEGVESYEQFYFLKIMGCDAIQGYYFSKPMNEDAFIAQLNYVNRNDDE